MSNEQKIVLIQLVAEGKPEIEIRDGELKIGRGETVDVRVASRGLSRHHASIFRENGRIWILDNDSTNGSFVNDQAVSATGTPLKHNDSIRLGDDTVFKVQFVSEKNAAKIAPPNAPPKTSESASQSTNLAKYAPFAVALIAVAIIGLAIVIVAARSISNAEEEPATIAQTNDEAEENADDELIQNQNSNRKKSKSENSNSASLNAANANAATVIAAETSEVAQPAAPRAVILPSKTYLEMSDQEKREFIERESIVVARMIGNRSGDAAPPAAIERIKSFVDGYARRLKTPKRAGTCGFSDNLETVIERASQNAAFIVPAFNSEGLAPQLGLYLAMIESEHCVCLQSPTGPLGMFQFTRATGAGFGLETRAGASPANPDERCLPEKAAPAAARYMKFLSGRYGTGALSVPLAIASYNSGEGGLSSNLQTALAEETNQERSFWTLVANEGKLSAQFQKENIKYVPKFFAAAIVGENPTVFGVKKPPISSNTK